MRIVFWGSPAFAVPTLEALSASRHEVLGVVTQPDRARGRGGRVSPTPVGLVAAGLGVPVLKPDKPRGDAFLAELGGFEADVFVVAAYGEILGTEVLDLPPLGAYNVHASLLPAYRGAAPVTQAIFDGQTETGITIMRMDAGLDTGPICLQARTPIGPDDTAGSVTERLAALGAQTIVEALDRLERGELVETEQDESGATYAPKVSADRARIDWSAPAAVVERAVRAFDPWPGAWTTWRDERLKVFRVAVAPAEGAPGELVAVDPDPIVAVGDGAVALLSVQPPGGRRISGGAWSHGHRPRVGESLGDG